GCQGGQDGNRGEERIGIEEAEVLDEIAGRIAREQQHLAIALEHRQGNGQVVRVPVDDVTSLLPFHRQLVQPGNDRRHELHDDGGGGVGIDAERNDREVVEAATGEEVQHAEQLVRLDVGPDPLPVDAGNRDAGDHSKDHQHRQGKQDFPTNVGNLEGV